MLVLRAANFFEMDGGGEALRALSDLPAARQPRACRAPRSDADPGARGESVCRRVLALVAGAVPHLARLQDHRGRAAAEQEYVQRARAHSRRAEPRAAPV